MSVSPAELKQKTVSKVSMKVSPDPTLRVQEATKVPHIQLLANEPEVMLGADREPPMVTTGVSPDAATCFGPRGAALMAADGPFWICDTGHHRLLGWNKKPVDDRAPADVVIGQRDFEHEGRNGKADITASSVNVPTGICRCGDGMAVADAWNHRILIWNTLPESDNVPADIVLGQSGFSSGEPNRGLESATADSMHWPYGVHWHEGRLFVADSENRRVLIWNSMPVQSGQPADIVLGQVDFTHRDENAGHDPDAMSMRWPHGIAIWHGHLCVSDAGNNRIMIWKGIPQEHGTACDYVLGQDQTDLVDHNQSLYWPRANTLNMPYAITVIDDWLITADTASSRLLGWHIDDLETGAAARALTGQYNFHDKGDNRWQPPCSDSLCWPYGIQSVGDNVVVSDSGNNRVSIWKFAQ